MQGIDKNTIKKIHDENLSDPVIIGASKEIQELLSE